MTAPTTISYTYNVNDPLVEIPVYAFTYSGPSCSDFTFTYGITPTPSTYTFATLFNSNNTLQIYTTDNSTAGTYTFNNTVSISIVPYEAYYILTVIIVPLPTPPPSPPPPPPTPTPTPVIPNTAPYFTTNLDSIIINLGDT